MAHGAFGSVSRERSLFLLVSAEHNGKSGCMKIALLTALTMVAFAANSLLTRLAVDGGHADPASFAILRVLAGAVVLAALVLPKTHRLPLKDPMRLIGAVSLAVYMVGFSVAYVTLDAGLGALILFGVVQISMFLYAALRGQTPSMRQLMGASIAFVGLLVALWPGAGSGSRPGIARPPR